METMNSWIFYKPVSTASKGQKKSLPYPKVDTKDPMALWQCFSMHGSSTISNSLRKGSTGPKILTAAVKQ